MAAAVRLDGRNSNMAGHSRPTTAGSFAAARTLCLLLVLAAPPAAAAASAVRLQMLCNAGMLREAAGHVEAARSAGSLAEGRPERAAVLAILDDALRKQLPHLRAGRMGEEEAAGLGALLGVHARADPRNALARGTLGDFLLRRGARHARAATGPPGRRVAEADLRAAAREFEAAAELEPSVAGHWYRLGRARELGRLGPNPAAVRAFGRAVDTARRENATRSADGAVLGQACFKRAQLTLTDPSVPLEAVWEDMLCSLRALPAAAGAGAAGAVGEPQMPVSWRRLLGPGYTAATSEAYAGKVNHLMAQWQHLARAGKLPAARTEALSLVARAMSEAGDPSRGTGGAYVPLESLGDPVKAVLDGVWDRVMYHPSLHGAPGDDGCGGPCLSPDVDWAAVQADYLSGDNAPGLAVVDDWLTPRALHSLRVLAHDATVWTDAKHGYVGARVSHGLCNRAMVSIARELHLAMPRVLCAHRLQQAWSYKYDQAAQSATVPSESGIGLHADPAAVNLNWWVSEDAASQDPESGGMVVYLHEAPLDWGFADFQTPGKIRQHLRGLGDDLRQRTIAHRPNRLVLFKSSLFHETDRASFKRGYRNRRINFTYLFGQRGMECPALQPAAGDHDEL